MPGRVRWIPNYLSIDRYLRVDSHGSVEINEHQAYNRSMKRITFVLVFSLLISGCQVLSGILSTDTPIPPTAAIPFTNTPVPPTPDPSDTPPPPEPTLTPAQPLLLITEFLQETGDNPDYSLKVSYPQFQGFQTPQLQAFNQYSKQMAAGLFDSYRSEITKQPGTPDPNFQPTFMEATYQVTNGTDGLLSILYTVADYWSGAAHPNQHALVLNFNLITGQEITLADLFLPGSNYLQVISDYCITELNKQDRLMFDAGAQPTTGNYQNWNITPGGLLISFDPYQVAPYAMGPSRVTIPYSALNQILRPGGPLAALIQ